MPFISTTVQSKLVHRAVCSNDQKLLQKCIDDLKNIAFVSISYWITSHIAYESVI